MNTKTESLIKRLQYLIEKAESQRTNVIGRATTMLTAASIIIASFSILTRHELPDSTFELATIIFLIAIGIFSTLTSLTFSILSITHIFKRSRDLIGLDVAGLRLFVHCRETVKKFGNDYKSYSDGFKTLSDEDFLEALLSDLWTINHLHARAFDSVRRAGIFLLLGASSLVALLFVRIISAFDFSILF